MGLLAALSWTQWFIVAIIICVCLLMMLIILVQKGRGEGLTGAFGGGGGSSAFGAKTGDVFTWITVVVAAAFLLLNVVANFALDESPENVSAVAPTAEPGTVQPESEPGEGATGMAPIEIPNVPTGEGGAIEIKPGEVEDSVPPAGTESTETPTGAADEAVDEPADQPTDSDVDGESAEGDAGADQPADEPQGESEETPSP